MHTRGIGKAFDLSTEDPRTIARYDTRHLFDEKKLQRWNDMRRATNKLGLQMLMARKRCEAGCGFVTAADCGWDYHANNTLFDLNLLRVTGGPPGEIINLANRAEPIPELFG